MSGIAGIGILVSATAILNLLASGFSLPLSEWLSSILTKYQELFYPLVDASIGRLLALFGKVLSDTERDFLMIYGVGYAAYVRLGFEVPAADTEKRYHRIMVQLGFGLAWPLIVFVAAGVVATNGKRGYQTPDQKDLPVEALMETKSFLNRFFLEVIYIALVCLAAIILNSAGLLE